MPQAEQTKIYQINSLEIATGTRVGLYHTETGYLSRLAMSLPPIDPSIYYGLPQPEQESQLKTFLRIKILPKDELPKNEQIFPEQDRRPPLPGSLRHHKFYTLYICIDNTNTRHSPFSPEELEILCSFFIHNNKPNPIFLIETEACFHAAEFLVLYIAARLNQISEQSSITQQNSFFKYFVEENDLKSASSSMLGATLTSINFIDKLAPYIKNQLREIATNDFYMPMRKLNFLREFLLRAIYREGSYPVPVPDTDSSQDVLTGSTAVRRSISARS